MPISGTSIALPSTSKNQLSSESVIVISDSDSDSDIEEVRKVLNDCFTPTDDENGNPYLHKTYGAAIGAHLDPPTSATNDIPSQGKAASQEITLTHHKIATPTTVEASGSGYETQSPGSASKQL